MRTVRAKSASLFRRDIFDDDRGSSAVEFAFIAPILILLYFGAVEIGNALTADRRSGDVASSAADLVGRAKSVTAPELENIMDESGAIMAPFSANTLSITLSSVVADPDNVGRVD